MAETIVNPNQVDLSNYILKPTTIISAETTPSFTNVNKVAQNTHYVFTNALTSLTFGSGSIDTTFVGTTFNFTVGSSFTFSYLSSGVKFEGEVPTLESGKEYVMLISNNIIYTSSEIVTPTE